MKWEISISAKIESNIAHIKDISLFYYRGDGFENYKIQSVELRRAIMNTIHQFWDTNGTKTVWKVGDPDYKVENLDLEYLDLTQPYM